MSKVLAVILAAGRGSRMKGFTDNKPKCLLELAGMPLLQWQMQALQKAGIHDILVMRGYQAHMIRQSVLPWAPPFMVADNSAWATSNMLRTLYCADAAVREAFVGGVQGVLVCYADIVYTARHIQKLCAATENMAITYDTLWEKLWSLRFADPLCDAESFTQSGGLLTSIGEKPCHLNSIEGQYMGLLYFNQHGWEQAYATCIALGDALDTTDMTGFLRLLLSQGKNIEAIPVQGQWCEADNQEDLRLYEACLAQGSWTHDWRV